MGKTLKKEKKSTTLIWISRLGPSTPKRTSKSPRDLEKKLTHMKTDMLAAINPKRVRHLPKREQLVHLSSVLELKSQSSFARALIEIRVKDELKDSLIVVIPLLNGSGFCKEVVHVEYEWKPSRCHSCKKNYPTIDQCPRNIVPLASSVEKSDDGFQHAVNKRLRNSKNDNAKAGLKNGRTMCSNFKYVPKVTGNSSKYSSATAKVEHDSLFDANSCVVNKCDRLDGSSIQDATVNQGGRPKPSSKHVIWNNSEKDTENNAFWSKNEEVCILPERKVTTYLHPVIRRIILLQYAKEGIPYLRLYTVSHFMDTVSHFMDMAYRTPE
ncbi:hypothetical protein Tco_0559666 [Tanacetum coccineum]